MRSGVNFQREKNTEAKSLLVGEETHNRKQYIQLKKNENNVGNESKVCGASFHADAV
jgi:hypothetical protein